VADLWPMIKAEREANADTLAGLSSEQLSTPSLCAGWSIRDVAGHMIGAAEMTFGSFYARLVKSGFKFNAMTDRLAHECNSGDGPQLANRLRAKAGGPNHPPGPVAAMLGEAVVHGEDLRRPLGQSRAIPQASLVAVADFYKKSNLIIGAKRRIAGLQLKATDTDWQSGDGPLVSGPLVSLIMAMAGRKAAIADLQGEGVSTLAQRP
jgi:uncharacterized protein (TIGR03083 family)